MAKKKVLIIVGAGASIELGMPSIVDIDNLFNKWALEELPLADDGDQSLYGYIRERINNYYSHNPKSGLRKKTNFEEVLYVILELSTILGDKNLRYPINSLIQLDKPTTIKLEGKTTDLNSYELRNLLYLLIDNLLYEFRQRCINVQTEKISEFKIFQEFMVTLHDEFDVGFVSLNYDNLITQAIPNLFTGFNKLTGEFNPSDVYKRKKWEFIYHMHGSVHFDMQGMKQDMHAIKWNVDLNSHFQQNSQGRSPQETNEEIYFPTSVMIVGYGKVNQIQRLPFRTYYSQLDKLIDCADAFLFLGYGFNDIHLNNCFHSIRKEQVKRPVVIVDYSNDKQDPLQFRHDKWVYNLSNSIAFDAHRMTGESTVATAPSIYELKKNREFEISRDPSFPLAIWHGGFIDACSNYEKVKQKLFL